MGSLRSTMARFIRDERGLSATEYGILIAFLGVALVAVVKVAGPALAAFFQKGATDLGAQTG